MVERDLLRRGICRYLRPFADKSWTSVSLAFLGNNPLSLIDPKKLVRRDIGQPLPGAARPFDLYRRNVGIFSQPERHREIALRTVTRPAAHRAPLLARRALHPYHRADPIAIRLTAHRPDRKPVVPVSPVVAI